MESCVYTGTKKLEANLKLVDIWLGFHKRADSIQTIPIGTDEIKTRELTYGTDCHFLNMLEKVIVSDWLSLCEGIGMTVYGAVALSWCEGAELDQVWQCWEASGFPLLPKPEFERPARFINPKLMPRTQSLREITIAADGQVLPFCAMVAAAEKPLDFDLPANTLQNVDPQVAAFLCDRMMKKKDRTVAEDALIADWNDIMRTANFAAEGTT